MKRHFIIFSTAIVSIGIMAFSNPFNETSPTECHVVVEEPVYSFFTYDLGPRFEPITKSKLSQASTVADFFSADHVRPLMDYESVEVVIVENDKQTDKRLSNNFYKLTEEQKNMLLELDYSQHFIIKTVFPGVNKETGELDYKRAEPHFTVVPETQATYGAGNWELIELIKKGNKENTANLDEDKLQYAKLYFTVSANGSLKNVYLDRSSGIKKIDNSMINLLTNAPGKWTPAKSAQGKTIDQELAITFGIGGC